MSTRRIARIILAAALLSPAAVRGDEVEDKLREAFKAYGAKEYSTAVKVLREAITAIEEKNARAVVSVLPADLGDWVGEQPGKEDLSLLGGGSSVKRSYKNGEKVINAKIVKDSPLVEKLMALFANEDLLKITGAETRTVSGETAVLEGGDGTKPAALRMAVDGRILVELIGGKGVSKTDLLGAARRIDIPTLKKMK